jgi:hypothetical protein
MNIKGLVDSHFKDGKFHYDVSSKELNEFIKEFKQINELKKMYKEGIGNRRELGEEILERAEDLKKLMYIFERSLFRDKEVYEYPFYISDFNKVLELLLALANKEKNEYTLKVFQSSEIRTFEITKKYCKSIELAGDIWVIGKKDVLSSMDNTEPYYGAKFGNIMTKLVEDGNSIVMITNNSYANNVIPHHNFNCSNYKQFNVTGLISDLYCYTFDDELNDAVNQLSNYINTYGGNIDNISLDIILTRIEDQEKTNDNKVFQKKRNEIEE